MEQNDINSRRRRHALRSAGQRARSRRGVFTRAVYIDGYGNEKDIADMDDGHIVNTIGFITKKMADLVIANEALIVVDIHSATLADRIDEMKESVIALGLVLLEREEDDADKHLPIL